MTKLPIEPSPTNEQLPGHRYTDFPVGAASILSYLLTIAVLCCLPLLAQIDSAISLAKQHRYKEADAALQGVAPPTSTPQRIAFHRLKAAIASGNGDAASSAREMEAALELAPADPGLLFATGVSEAQAELLAPALTHLQRAASLRDSAALENTIADLQEKRGDSLAAVKSYQTAVALAPREEEYRFALALELLRHQTFDPAMAVLEQGVTDFPRSSRMRIALSVAYFLVDRDADASRTLLDAMKAAPEDGAVADYLGEMQLTQSAAPDPEAVRELCQFADAHATSGRAQAFCGGLLLREEKDALSRLKTAVRLASHEPVAQCQLGKALEARQNWAEARAPMEECARLQPDSAEAHYRLARIYRKAGLADLAKQQDQMRAEADRKQTADNERRYGALTKFIYSQTGGSQTGGSQTGGSVTRPAGK
ncbi:MAG: tetratricopeptide repeat protein [Bryobacteraceae bacterium]